MNSVKTHPKSILPLPRYDSCFKAIFVQDLKKEGRLIEKLIAECLDEEVKFIRFINPELSKRKINERAKTVDCLVEVKGKMINIEINTGYGRTIRVRNLNFFTAFYSEQTKTGERYNSDTKFIQINLVFGEYPNKPKRIGYSLYSKENDEEYIDNFKIIEIYVDNYYKLWYTKSKQEIRKSPLLTLLSIKEEREIEEYKEYSKNMNVKEIVEKMEDLRGSEEMKWDYERDEILLRNTIIYEARKEGLALGREEGIEQGIEQGKEYGAKENSYEIAKNMLKNNISIDIIMDCTKLKQNDIEIIKQDLAKN